ncbi:hypothetical protein AB0K60_08795 [Thermopolyspora sp. NPDC052614]|uniref:hypothetical protein n=1 Tax=Thermopolyspora sp. NPDC052614 TaxID=3155682 RepID=UPI003443935A
MKNLLIRACALITTLAVAVLGAAACSGEQESTAACGTVIDTTGFAEIAKSEELIKQQLPGFLGKCGWVAYAAITGSSVGSSCQQQSLALQGGNNDNELVRKKVREELIGQAGERARGLLTCNDGSSGSDVLGGLQMIADRLDDAPDGAGGQRRIIVFSDLMNNKGINFKSCDFGEPTARSGVVDKLKSGGRIPDLGGVAVTVYGFNLLEERRPECVPPLKELWKAIFAAAGVDESNLRIL